MQLCHTAAASPPFEVQPQSAAVLPGGRPPAFFCFWRQRSRPSGEWTAGAGLRRGPATTSEGLLHTSGIRATTAAAETGTTMERTFQSSCPYPRRRKCSRRSRRLLRRRRAALRPKRMPLLPRRQQMRKERSTSRRATSASAAQSSRKGKWRRLCSLPGGMPAPPKPFPPLLLLPALLLLAAQQQTRLSAGSSVRQWRISQRRRIT